MQVTSTLNNTSNASLLANAISPDALNATPQPNTSDFANLLRQNQPAPAAPKAPVPAPPPQAAAPEPEAAADPAPVAQATPKPAPAPAPAPTATAPAPSNNTARTPDKPKAASAAPAPKQATTQNGNTAKAEAAARAERANDTTTATSNDPALAAWLAQLHALAAASSKSTPSGDAGGGTGTDGGNDVGGTRSNDAALPSLQTDAGADAANGITTAQDANPAAFAAVMAEAAGDEHGAGAHKAEAGKGSDAISSLSATAAASGIAAPAPSSTHSAAAPTEVSVPTPVDSPDFPQALGVHLSVLAKDGVQQAELHLNPADMGPVSVHIQLDGNQARIDFGADVAATRHAIEAGLPELASALRDAGLTLTGGGVSQQSRGGQGEQEQRNGSGTRGVSGVSGGGSDVAAPDAPATTRRTVSLGGVDTYA